MADRKENRRFVFSVEGDTEKWYLDWLQRTINTNPNAVTNVIIDAKVEKSPMKFMKTLNSKNPPSAVHLCDVEGQTSGDITTFEKTLKELKDARKQKGVKYSIGYSNLSFELWLLLHKQDCFGSLNTKSKYLSMINTCFSANFESLREYKKERNFDYCLSKISLEDVKNAIDRAERIMKNNLDAGRKLTKVAGFSYYRENPSLNINMAVKIILAECGL